MPRDADFRQGRGSCFATVDGIDTPVAVPGNDRRVGPSTIRLISPQEQPAQADLRRRQIDACRETGLLALRVHDPVKNAMGRKIGVFRGRVVEDGPDVLFRIDARPAR